MFPLEGTIVPVEGTFLPLSLKGDMMTTETEKAYLKGEASCWPLDDPSQPPQTVYFVPPKNKKYPARWLLLWQDPSEIGVSMVEQAKMEKPLTQTEYRVRDYLMGTIGIGNCVYVNQAEVARELNLRRPKVCEAIQRLVALGILLKGPKSGRSNTYTVSPAFCFAGSLRAGIEKRKELIKETKKAKVIKFPQE